MSRTVMNVAKVCSACWYDMRSDQYFPFGKTYGDCDGCGEFTEVHRVRWDELQDYLRNKTAERPVTQE